MKILVTGGGGFVGTELVAQLLLKGHRVLVLDAFWFGNHLRQDQNLTLIENDMREIDGISLPPVDCVIHLANIANDPSVELNPYLSWEVNVLATMRLLEKCSRSQVPRFIFASSGSVYGVKSEERVTEELELLPISEYNRTKMVAERVVLGYSDKMQVYCIRPATVCGFSRRMRLDLAVNLLTFQALSTGKIRVLGGSQVRPNIHIDDMVAAYQFILDKPNLPSGIYNAGFENLSIIEIAKMIQSKIDCSIEVAESNDPRSYRLDSSKFLGHGFKPSKGVAAAVVELKEAFENGKLKDSPQWHNVKWMKDKETR